jgi:Rho GDP-dissociation inhibitor
MASNHDDELAPEQTQGFKVGEKKTLDEYHQLGPRRNASTSTSA